MTTSTKPLLLIITFFFSSFLLFPPAIISTAPLTSCPISACGNTTVRFPFRLAANSTTTTTTTTTHQPPICRYHEQPSGFVLTCHQQKMTPSLNLPNSGNFLVKNIDYMTQTLQLIDPENCLPRRLLLHMGSGIDITEGSPFLAHLPSKKTLFSCPKEFSNTAGMFTHVECLGNKTRSVWAVGSNRSAVADSLLLKCQKFRDVMLPGGERYDALDLRWDKPDCRQCETDGGTCGGVDKRSSSSSSTGQDLKVECHPGSRTAGSSLKILKIISMSIALPAITCAICTGIFFCLVDRDGSDLPQQQATMTPEYPPPVVIGLEQSTIDTCTTKVVLGESKRVPGLNDGTCPICLSEFNTSESIRCIPECQHCFHVDCIDEWLRINGLCPLCRMSPSPAQGS